MENKFLTSESKDLNNLRITVEELHSIIVKLLKVEESLIFSVYNSKHSKNLVLKESITFEEFKEIMTLKNPRVIIQGDNFHLMIGNDKVKFDHKTEEIGNEILSYDRPTWFTKIPKSLWPFGFLIVYLVMLLFDNFVVTLPGPVILVGLIFSLVVSLYFAFRPATKILNKQRKGFRDRRLAMALPQTPPPPKPKR